MNRLFGRKTLWSTAAMAVFCFATASLAALLGIVPGHPQMSFESQNATSTQIAGGVLTVNSTPQKLLLSPMIPPLPVNVGFVGPNPPTLTIGATVDASCDLVGGVGGDDLVITGSVDLGGGDVRTGTLLTGEVLAMGSAETGATDAFDFRFEVTGGLLSDFYDNEDAGLALNVESSTFTGDCSVDSEGESKGSIGPIPPILPAEGCTPGYWKQKHHFDSWVGFDPDTDTVIGVFGALDPTVDNLLLKDALKLGGGGLKALMRHAVASLLNASSGDVNSVDYPTTADVIAATQAAVNGGGDIETQKDAFEANNESGCPLN